MEPGGGAKTKIEIPTQAKLKVTYDIQSKSDNCKKKNINFAQSQSTQYNDPVDYITYAKYIFWTTFNFNFFNETDQITIQTYGPIFPIVKTVKTINGHHKY